jgi:DNA invertase Pin-like site-specific DNA recombinase
MTPKAYSYIRFSTPEQARGDSLRRQVALAEAWAAREGLTLDERLTDAGLSAFSGMNRERGALGTFLAAVEAGRVPRGSTLIVESLDRLSRQTVLPALQGLLDLIQAGIRVVTLLDGQIYSQESIGQEPTKLMISIAYMMRAHDESSTKSVRVAGVWGAKRQRAAEKPGGAMTRMCVGWCRVVGDVRTSARYELIPERAEVIGKIFKLTAEGHGQRAVAARLNRDGVAAWGRGDGWHASYVTKILGTRAVLGFYQPHTKPRKDVRRTPQGAEIPNYYPPVIDEDLYYRALAARTGRRGKGGKKGEGVSNLLSGLGKCASCGRAMIHTDKGAPPKGGRYLTCDSALRGLPCDSPARWRYDRAESAVLKGVRRLDSRRIMGVSDPATDALARVTALKAQLATEEQRRGRLIDALGDVKDPAVIARLRAAADTVARLTSELSEATKAASIAGREGTMEDKLALVGELTERMSALSGNELTDLRLKLAQELKRVVKRLRFTTDNILADYRPDGSASRLTWITGVPLLQSAADAAEHAWHAERTTDSQLGGEKRTPALG